MSWVMEPDRQIIKDSAKHLFDGDRLLLRLGVRVFINGSFRGKTGFCTECVINLFNAGSDDDLELLPDLVHIDNAGDCFHLVGIKLAFVLQIQAQTGHAVCCKGDIAFTAYIFNDGFCQRAIVGICICFSHNGCLLTFCGGLEADRQTTSAQLCRNNTWQVLYSIFLCQTGIL